MLRQCQIAFIKSAGGLLSALAAALFISNGASAGFVQPHDPILLLSMREIFWLTGLIALVVALVCFLANAVWLKASLLLWFSSALAVYEFGLIWYCGPRSLGGCWGALGAAYGASPWMVESMMCAVSVYLLGGSLVLAFGSWVEGRSRARRKIIVGYLKTSCGSCGGHIEYPIAGIGQTVACPHCSASFILKSPSEKPA
jgi:hypothetical protein